MKKMMSVLLFILLLIPVLAMGEEATASPYHELYEGMKADHAELSWEQLKEITGGEECFYELPDFHLRLYDPLGTLTVDDKASRNGFQKYYQGKGLELSGNVLTFRYEDEIPMKFSIAVVNNPESAVCNVPLDHKGTSARKGNFPYVENTLQINGFSCPCTWFVSASNGLRVFTISALLRTSEEDVLFIRGTMSLPNDSSSDETDVSYLWEKGLGYLLCFCPPEESSSYDPTLKGPAIVYGELDDSDSITEDSFIVWEPFEKCTLALVEGGESMIFGIIRMSPCVVTWEIRNEEGTALYRGANALISSVGGMDFRIPFPNCFESAGKYEIAFSSDKKVHSMHLDVIEATDEMYPCYDRLEILEPAEGSPLEPVKINTEGTPWYYFSWKESSHGIVHLHIQGDTFEKDEVFNAYLSDDPSENAINGVYYPLSMLKEGQTYTLTLEQENETVSRTFTTAK